MLLCEMHGDMHLNCIWRGNYIRRGRRDRNRVPLDGEVDLPKHWVLLKEYQEVPFYPGSSSPLTYSPSPTSTISSTAFFPLGLRLCSVLVKSQRFWEEITPSSYQSFILYCEGVSGSCFPESRLWRPGRGRVLWALWWGWAADGGHE